MLSVAGSSDVSGSGKPNSSKAETALESFLCGVDSALNLKSFNVNNWAYLGDESTCGSERWWGDDHTLATTYTAFTGCTGCTDYTGYTGCTDYTGYTGYYTASTQVTDATRDAHSTAEKDSQVMSTMDEIREETEESGGLTDDDLSADVTVAVANQLKEANDAVMVAPQAMALVPPIAIEFTCNTYGGTIIPLSDDCSVVSSPADVPSTAAPPAIEVTVEDYLKSTEPRKRKTKGLRKHRSRKAA